LEKGAHEAGEYLGEIEEQVSEDAIVQLVFSTITEGRTEVDKEKITGQIKAAYKRYDEKLSLHWDEIYGEINNYEDALGVYTPLAPMMAVMLVPDYDFASSLTLPGRVIETNSLQIDKATVKWNFTNWDFFTKDHIIYAKSRRINWNSIFALLIGLLTLTFIVMRAHRIRQRRAR